MGKLKRMSHLGEKKKTGPATQMPSCFVNVFVMKNPAPPDVCGTQDAGTDNKNCFQQTSVWPGATCSTSPALLVGVKHCIHKPPE